MLLFSPDAVWKTLVSYSMRSDRNGVMVSPGSHSSRLSAPAGEIGATRAGAAAMAQATICGRASGARATAALTMAGTTPGCSGAGTARTAAQATAGANGVRSGTARAAMAEVTTLGARARRSAG